MKRFALTILAVFAAVAAVANTGGGTVSWGQQSDPSDTNDFLVAVFTDSHTAPGVSQPLSGNAGTYSETLPGSSTTTTVLTSKNGTTWTCPSGTTIYAAQTNVIIGSVGWNGGSPAWIPSTSVELSGASFTPKFYVWVPVACSGVTGFQFIANEDTEDGQSYTFPTGAPHWKTDYPSATYDWDQFMISDSYQTYSRTSPFYMVDDPAASSEFGSGVNWIYEYGTGSLQCGAPGTQNDPYDGASITYAGSLGSAVYTSTKGSWYEITNQSAFSPISLLNEITAQTNSNVLGPLVQAYHVSNNCADFLAPFSCTVQ
jgi:hypothetical protein